MARTLLRSRSLLGLSPRGRSVPGTAAGRGRPALKLVAWLGVAAASLACVSTPIGPNGWPLVYSEDFDGECAGAAFEFSDPDAWRVVRTGARSYLEQFAASRYEAPFRSPLNLAVLVAPAVGDFVLEAELKQTGREYPHRDMCVVFGFRDAAHFAYVHLASAADDNAHHVQLVDGAPRTPVTTARSSGVAWGSDEWRTVRVERRGDGVRVWFDGASQPVLVAEGLAAGEGRIGFGTFDDTGAIDSVRLWAPRVAPEARAPAFVR